MVKNGINFGCLSAAGDIVFISKSIPEITARTQGNGVDVLMLVGDLLRARVRRSTIRKNVG